MFSSGLFSIPKVCTDSKQKGTDSSRESQDVNGRESYDEALS